jgi:hypothetical protein
MRTEGGAMFWRSTSTKITGFQRKHWDVPEELSLLEDQSTAMLSHSDWRMQSKSHPSIVWTISANDNRMVRNFLRLKGRGSLEWCLEHASLWIQRGETHWIHSQCQLLVKQVFCHNLAAPADVRYIVPNDSKICMYDTTFRIGSETIKVLLVFAPSLRWSGVEVNTLKKLKKFGGVWTLWSLETHVSEKVIELFKAFNSLFRLPQGIAPSIKVSVLSRSWSNRELPDNLAELAVSRIPREYITARNVVRPPSTLAEGLWKSEIVHNSIFFWLKYLSAPVSSDCWKCRYVADPTPELV